MLQEKLKQATQANHDTLEGLMFVHQIMGGTLSLQQYKQILTTNYLVHQHFEDALANGLNPTITKDLEIYSRRKLGALAADMLEIHLDLQGLNTDLPETTFDNQAEVLGALYVLEGATLGGNVIVKRLKVNPQLNSLNLGFHYYQVYGENLVPNWKKFVAILNKQPEDTCDASVNGAKKMFEYIAAVQQVQNKQAIA